MADTSGPDASTQEEAQAQRWLDELRREVRSAAEGRTSDVRKSVV